MTHLIKMDMRIVSGEYHEYSQDEIWEKVADYEEWVENKYVLGRIRNYLVYKGTGNTNFEVLSNGNLKEVTERARSANPWSINDIHRNDLIEKILLSEISDSLKELKKNGYNDKEK